MRYAAVLFVALGLSLLACREACAQQQRASPSGSAGLLPRLAFVTPSADARQLAALLAGPGVTIGNARYVGDALAAGSFGGGQADVGIDGGVVLSTGNVAGTQGPNRGDNLSTDFRLPGDASLDTLAAPAITRDAAILEFDVTPDTDTISVRFVFASEEYNEFVGTRFHDVVGIFVNGVNCANRDGLLVSANTVNNVANPALYFDNALGERGTSMDGMTVPLECVAAVVPGVAQRVKIAIADTGDPIYDAAVFLAAGSVRSPGAGAPTTSIVAKAIEYYHAAFDHFFVTAIADEIEKLDDGTLTGWVRTGLAFNVYSSPMPGTVEVCRFFSTAFGTRSSHFYTPSEGECASTKQNPDWQFEAAVFNVALPNPDGTCRAGTEPLFRMYNNGVSGAPNHRYATDNDAFGAMRVLDWTPEGAGAGVVGCVPR